MPVTRGYVRELCIRCLIPSLPLPMHPRLTPETAQWTMPLGQWVPWASVSCVAPKGMCRPQRATAFQGPKGRLPLPLPQEDSGGQWGPPPHAHHSPACLRRPGVYWKGGSPPPPSRAPGLCPATVPPTPSAGFNGTCDRQSPPPTQRGGCIPVPMCRQVDLVYCCTLAVFCCIPCCILYTVYAVFAVGEYHAVCCCIPL